MASIPKWVEAICREVTECVAIAALALIAIEALKYGVDHFLLVAVSLIIGGIAGYDLKWLREKLGL